MFSFSAAVGAFGTSAGFWEVLKLLNDDVGNDEGIRKGLLGARTLRCMRVRDSMSSEAL